MSNLYLEILDKPREQVFRQLAAFEDDGYLAGGTALALQLGHRRSFDFDVFVPKSLTKRFFSQKVVPVFGSQIETRVDTGDMLIFETPAEVKIGFVYYWYDRLEPLVESPSIKLASVKDIAADKARTIGRRGQWRDYVDIFYLLQSETLTLAEMMELANRKFRPEFNPRLFLEQLTYYGDIHDFEIVWLGEGFSTGEIQSFLRQAVGQYSEDQVKNAQ